MIGKTAVALPRACQTQECLLGDMITDAMLAYRKNSTSDVDFALTNAGGIRAAIDVGNITRGEVLTTFPFGNAVVDLDFSGKDLWTVFEGVFSAVNQVNGRAVTSGVQVSKGVKIEYNPSANNGSKLLSFTIGDRAVTKDSEKTFKVVANDFLAGGGDNFWEPRTGFAVLDTLDEVMTAYIQSFGGEEINVQLERRMVQTNATTNAAEVVKVGLWCQSWWTLY